MGSGEGDALRVTTYRVMLDGSPCWCVSTEKPHEGWIHSPTCEVLREKNNSDQETDVVDIETPKGV